MNVNNDIFKPKTVRIPFKTPEEEAIFEKYLVDHGLKKGPWLKHLIKRELISAGVASAPPMQPTYLSGTAIKEE